MHSPYIRSRGEAISVRPSRPRAETNAPKRGKLSELSGPQIAAVCETPSTLCRDALLQVRPAAKECNQMSAGMDTQAIAGMNITKSRPAFK
jgi:hypothetical protein